MKKIGIFLISCLILISSLSLVASAGCVGITGGTGASGDPWVINNCTELQAMSGDSDCRDDYFILGNDIDCSATSTWNWNGSIYLGFVPIGCGLSNCGSRTINSYFNGVLDGNNKVITGLYINRPAEWYAGLFGSVNTTGKVTNLGLEEINISGSSSSGGLVAYNLGNLTKVYSTGSVTNSGLITGGLVGRNAGIIKDAYSIVNVAGTNQAGGLVGYNLNTSTSPLCLLNLCYIENSFAAGNVSGSGGSGGLVGSNNNAGVRNSFFAGYVTGTSAVIGTLQNSAAVIINLYWNNNTGTPPHCWKSVAGVPNNTGCTAIQNNEAYFKGDVYPANQPMASWDFTTPVWYEWTDPADYPRLEQQPSEEPPETPVIPEFSTIGIIFALVMVAVGTVIIARRR